jgi:hypothetical protein
MLAPNTVTTLDDAARLLLSQVRALQRLHRAGLQPHYGQLETFFDTADILERQLNGTSSPEETAATSNCDTPGCTEKPFMVAQGSGRRMCFNCGAKHLSELVLTAWAPVGGVR